MRLKNRALLLGQHSIFNYGENWRYFYLAKLVKSILKRIGQKAIIAYFFVKKKNTNHLILAQKDGKEIFQSTQRIGQMFLNGFKNIQRK